MSVEKPRKVATLPVLLVHSFELTLSFALGIVSIIFTVFPDVLAHAPVGFETRGYFHHAWHYMLLVGAWSTFMGLVLNRPRMELAGLSLLIATLMINLITLATLGGEYPQQGMALAVRSGVLAGFGARAYLIGYYLPRLMRA